MQGIMVAHLVIDHREQAVKEAIAAFDHINNVISWENLEYGDFAIRDDDGTTQMLIERKTIKDLAASIKDGRYKHQKEGLKATNPPMGVYYVIEGALSYAATEMSVDGISYSAILSCVLNTCIRDRIQVFVTKDLADTMHLVSSIYSRIAKDPSKYILHDQKPSEPLVRNTHKTNDKGSCYEAQLCQIPGVSVTTARSITSRFPTMNQLCCALSSHGSSVLADIKVGSGKRCLANNLKERIVDFLAN